MRVVELVACLDVRDGRVVKGVAFQDLRDVCDPVEAAEAYCQQGVDGLVFLDIFATVESRHTRLDWVRRVAGKVTVPFTVGGGISSVDDAAELIKLGADRVSVNTAAVENPDLIMEIAREFGRDRVVVAVDGRKNPPGNGLPRLEVLTRSGTNPTGMDIVAWAREAEALGAGRILLTSKDADGTRTGFDLEMTRAVAEAVAIPVTASGGAGTLEHLYQAVSAGKASAVLVASEFHFGGMTAMDAKNYLKNRGIAVRI